jgi:hypothetical protein
VVVGEWGVGSEWVVQAGSLSARGMMPKEAGSTQEIRQPTYLPRQDILTAQGARRQAGRHTHP